jgi:alkyldihydroxyacetonephosphate synthase
MTAERSWWGWGTTDRALPDDECVQLARLVPGLPDRPRSVPRVGDLALPPSRLAAPAALPVTTEPAVRAAHTYGKAYRDVVRALSGDLAGAPDAVAHPSTEDDVVRLLDWAGSAGVVVVPFGGGS